MKNSERMKQWIIAGVSALLLAGNVAADRAPNILFFLADDLGYGDLGSHSPIAQNGDLWINDHDRKTR